MKKDEVKEEPKNQDEHGDLRKEWEKHKANHKKFMENHEQMMKKMDSFLGTKSFKDGGDVKKKDIDDTANLKFGDDDEDNQIKQEIAQSDEMQQPTPEAIQTPQPTLAPQQPQQQQTPQSPQTPEDSPDVKFEVPENVQQSLNAPSPEQFRQQEMQKDVAAAAANPDDVGKARMVKEDLAYQHDLANGHITPKTYADLFADKGTLGKISTLFGLLVGGAGSALAHQPDALLSMMDQQIKNDLDAQIHSKQNAQNFWKINQADLLNKTQGMQNVEAARATNYATSMAQMRQSTLHSLIQYVNKLPPAQQGPYRQALVGMSKEILQENNNAFDKAAVVQAINGHNPFNQNKPQPPQGNVAPKGDAGSIKSLKKDASKAVASSNQDHFLSSGANDAITNAVNYNPRFISQKEAILQQAGDVALADKATDAINDTIPKLRELSGESGYARRQSHLLSGVPVVGPFIEGVSHLASDSDTNRAYDSLYSRVEGAVRGALKGQVGAEELDRLVRKNAPEGGESYQTFETKLNTLKSYIKDHTKTNLLENIPGAWNKHKTK